MRFEHPELRIAFKIYVHREDDGRFTVARILEEYPDAQMQFSREYLAPSYIYVILRYASMGIVEFYESLLIRQSEEEKRNCYLMPMPNSKVSNAPMLGGDRRLAERVER